MSEEDGASAHLRGTHRMSQSRWCELSASTDSNGVSTWVRQRLQRGAALALQVKPEVGLTAEEAVRAQLDALATNDQPWQASQRLTSVGVFVQSV